MVGRFNLGDDEHDYRLPDGGLHRAFADRVFYAGHGIEELLIVDPQERTVSWLGLEAGKYKHLARSRRIELRKAELAEQIDWA